MRKRLLAACLCMAALLPVLTTCDSWMTGDDFFNEIDSEVNYANAEVISVVVQTAQSQQKSTLQPEGSVTEKAGISFGVTFAPTENYAFYKWAAFPLSAFDKHILYEDDDTYTEDWKPLELSAEDVSFADALAAETTCTVNRKDVVVVPVVAKRPELDDFITTPLSTAQNQLKNQTVRLGFTKRMRLSTFSGDNLQIERYYTGVYSDGSGYFKDPELSADGLQVIFATSNDPVLDSGARIRITLTEGITDEWGFSIPKEIKYWYSVGGNSDNNPPILTALSAGFRTWNGWSGSGEKTSTLSGDASNSTALSDWSGVLTHRVGAWANVRLAATDTTDGTTPDPNSADDDIDHLTVRSRPLVSVDGSAASGTATLNVVQKNGYISGFNACDADKCDDPGAPSPGYAFTYLLPASVPDGVIKLEAWAEDGAGNADAEHPYAIYVVKDTVAPVVADNKGFMAMSAAAAPYGWYNADTLSRITFPGTTGITDAGTEPSLRSSDVWWLFSLGDQSATTVAADAPGWKKTTADYTLDDAELPAADGSIPVYVALKDDVDNVSPLTELDESVRYDGTAPRFAGNLSWELGATDQPSLASSNVLSAAAGSERTLSIPFAEAKSASSSGLKQVVISVAREDGTPSAGTGAPEPTVVSADLTVAFGNRVLREGDDYELVTDGETNSPMSGKTVIRFVEPLASGTLSLTGLHLDSAANDGRYVVSVALMDAALNLNPVDEATGRAEKTITIAVDSTPPAIEKVEIPADDDGNERLAARTAHGSASTEYFLAAPCFAAAGAAANSFPLEVTIAETSSGVRRLDFAGSGIVPAAGTAVSVKKAGGDFESVAVTVRGSAIVLDDVDAPALVDAAPFIVRIESMRAANVSEEGIANAFALTVTDYAAQDDATTAITTGTGTTATEVYAEHTRPLLAGLSLADGGAEGDVEALEGYTNERYATLSATVTDAGSGVSGIRLSGATFSPSAAVEAQQAGATTPETISAAVSASGNEILFAEALRGTWTVRVSGVDLAGGGTLQDGTVTVTAAPVDAARWEGTARSASITVDTEAPQMEVPVVAAAASADWRKYWPRPGNAGIGTGGTYYYYTSVIEDGTASVRLTLSASDTRSDGTVGTLYYGAVPAPASAIEYSADGGTTWQSLSRLADGRSAAEQQEPLASGSGAYLLRAVDAAGNVSGTIRIQVVADTAAPDTASLAPAMVRATDPADGYRIADGAAATVARYAGDSHGTASLDDVPQLALSAGGVLAPLLSGSATDSPLKYYRLGTVPYSAGATADVGGKDGSFTYMDDGNSYTYDYTTAAPDGGNSQSWHELSGTETELRLAIPCHADGSEEPLSGSGLYLWLMDACGNVASWKVPAGIGMNGGAETTGFAAWTMDGTAPVAGTYTRPDTPGKLTQRDSVWYYNDDGAVLPTYTYTDASFDALEAAWATEVYADAAALDAAVSGWTALPGGTAANIPLPTGPNAPDAESLYLYVRDGVGNWTRYGFGTACYDNDGPRVTLRQGGGDPAGVGTGSLDTLVPPAYGKRAWNDGTGSTVWLFSTGANTGRDPDTSDAENVSRTAARSFFDLSVAEASAVTAYCYTTAATAPALDGTDWITVEDGKVPVSSDAFAGVLSEGTAVPLYLHVRDIVGNVTSTALGSGLSFRLDDTAPAAVTLTPGEVRHFTPSGEVSYRITLDSSGKWTVTIGGTSTEYTEKRLSFQIPTGTDFFTEGGSGIAGFAKDVGGADDYDVSAAANGSTWTLTDPASPLYATLPSHADGLSVPGIVVYDNVGNVLPVDVTFTLDSTPPAGTFTLQNGTLSLYDGAAGATVAAGTPRALTLLAKTAADDAASTAPGSIARPLVLFAPQSESLAISFAADSGVNDIGAAYLETGTVSGGAFAGSRTSLNVTATTVAATTALPVSDGGTYRLCVEDLFGNEAYVYFRYVLDDTPPAITEVTANADVYCEGTLYAAGADLSALEGKTACAQAPSDVSLTWTATDDAGSGLPDLTGTTDAGTHSFTVTDNMGNGATFTLVLEADATGPEVTAVRLSGTGQTVGGKTYYNSATAVVTASDGTEVTGFAITDSDTAPTPEATLWQTSSALPLPGGVDGALYVHVKDAFGNVSTVSLGGGSGVAYDPAGVGTSWKQDGDAPGAPASVALGTVAGVYVSGGTVYVSGAAPTEALFTVTAAAADDDVYGFCVGADGAVQAGTSVSIPLDGGTQTVYAVDYAGNKSAAGLAVPIASDTAAPAITKVTASADVYCEGALYAAGADLSALEGKTAYAQAPSGVSLTWTATDAGSGLPDVTGTTDAGTHSFTVTDNVGNGATFTLVLEADATRPDVSGIDLAVTGTGLSARGSGGAWTLYYAAGSMSAGLTVTGVTDAGIGVAGVSTDGTLTDASALSYDAATGAAVMLADLSTGTATLYVYDKLMNRTEVTVTCTEDAAAPALTLTAGTPTAASWTAFAGGAPSADAGAPTVFYIKSGTEGFPFTLAGDDGTGSGVEELAAGDGIIAADGTVTLAAGEHTLTATDAVGNVTTCYIKVIAATTAPAADGESLAIASSQTSGSIAFTLTGVTESGTGIAQVVLSTADGADPAGTITATACTLSADGTLTCTGATGTAGEDLTFTTCTITDNVGNIGTVTVSATVTIAAGTNPSFWGTFGTGARGLPPALEPLATTAIIDVGSPALAYVGSPVPRFADLPAAAEAPAASVVPSAGNVAAVTPRNQSAQDSREPVASGTSAGAPSPVASAPSRQAAEIPVPASRLAAEAPAPAALAPAPAAGGTSVVAQNAAVPAEGRPAADFPAALLAVLGGALLAGGSLVVRKMRRNA